MAHGDCRMYEAKFPEVDDVVMVQVKSIAEMGAYVSLLEYNNIEGMILLSELSRRRIRSITKLIKVCATYYTPPLSAPAAVLGLRCGGAPPSCSATPGRPRHTHSLDVAVSRGMHPLHAEHRPARMHRAINSTIDIASPAMCHEGVCHCRSADRSRSWCFVWTRRRATLTCQSGVCRRRILQRLRSATISLRWYVTEDVEPASWLLFIPQGDLTGANTQVHSIMRHVAETASADLEQLYMQIGWPLYKLYGHAFDALKSMVQEPDAVLQRLVEVRSRSLYMVWRFDGLSQPTSAWFQYTVRQLTCR